MTSAETVPAATQDSDRIDAAVWRVSMVVLIGTVMSILDTTIVNVALATLSRDLHATISSVQWVVTGYMLALGSAIPVSGWAGRRFGTKQVYLVSVVLFTGVPLLVYGLAEIGSTGSFTSAKVLGSIIGGLALIAVFAIHALRAPRPLLDLRLYRRPTFASASVAMFCLAAALFGAMILMPLYWQDVRHESVVNAGLLMAPQGLGAAFVMPLAGKLADRFGGG